MDDKINNGRVSYYYSREERLKKAPQQVRDLYKPSVNKKPNLFRTLTATKPLMFLFISVITLSAAIFFLSRFLTADGQKVLGNNVVVVSAIGSGDYSYITVKKTIKDTALKGVGLENVYYGPVDIAVSLSGEDGPIHAERIYFGPEEEELYRFKAPFRGKKLLVLMGAGAERALFTIILE